MQFVRIMRLTQNSAHAFGLDGGFVNTKIEKASEVVEVGELKLGMFVCELDRPWLGTPFLLQGFLIESMREIEQLRACCQHVHVDRQRSVGDQYAARSRRDIRRTGVATGRGAGSAGMSGAVPEPEEDSDFLFVARHLRQRQSFGGKPVRPSGRESRLEDELTYSASIIDDVHKTLSLIQQGADASGHVDLTRVRGLVEEMAAGVKRNADAMLWLTRLKITDQYSYDHAVDVSVHLMVFGRFLGLGDASIEDLGQAGLLQDIGKMAIDPDILSKPVPLTNEEYIAMQAHVASSLALLAGNIEFSREVSLIIAAHHERSDGSGYPRRLEGDRISLHAEMAGLIDTFCAMTRHRVFSDAVSGQKALESLARMRGVKFRAPLVDQFVQCVGLYPIGTLVELNTGEVAVVIQQNQVRRLRPRLLVLMAPDKSLERRPRGLNLMLVPNTPTGEPYRIVRALPSNAYGIDPVEFFLT